MKGKGGGAEGRIGGGRAVKGAERGKLKTGPRDKQENGIEGARQERAIKGTGKQGL